MAHLPRRFAPDSIYFVTTRTVDGRLFLRPSPEVNNIIGAVLADAQQRYRIELFDYVFLSNHMHLAVRSVAGQIPSFMQYLKANIAVAVNVLLDRRGHLWERRYAASPILDEGAQVERARYIYGHGVKEGLVERAAAWPGVASVKERLSGRGETYQRVDRTALSRAAYGRAEPPDPGEFAREVRVELTPWPFLAERTKAGARRRVAELVADVERQARGERAGRPALGIRAVLAQDPWTRPRSELERRPIPLCHASTAERARAYCEDYSRYIEAYRDASELFRSGELQTPFPTHSLPPPLPLDWTSKRAARAGPQASRGT